MKKGWVVVATLVALTPLFAYAAEMVGYSEPLENIAARIGVEEEPVYSGLIPDYTIPNLDPVVGTLVSAVIGVALTLVIVYGASQLLRKRAR